MTSNEQFVSVVAPLRTGCEVRNIVASLSDVLSAHYGQYEIVLVDDGCDDATASEAIEILDEFRYVRLIRLTRRFGFEVALLAGLESVIGDLVVVMRPEHDPPNQIPSIVQTAEQGYDIVTGVNAAWRRESLIARFAAWLFYSYANKVLDMGLPLHSTDFRVLSRRAVNAFIRIKDRTRHFRMYGAFTGFRSIAYPYEALPGAPARSLRQRIALSASIIVTNSIQPLRLVALLGLVAASLNVVYALYVIVVYFLKDDVAPGWATLSMMSSVMFFMLFVALVVIAEYLGRIVLETRDRPQYYVLEELNSRIVLDADSRMNVVSESTGDPDHDRDHEHDA